MKENEIDLLGGLNIYYRTKMNVLSKYLQIVWHRFSWFGTLHVGLISFYFTQIDKSSIYNTIPKIGLALSLIWLLIGFLDYITIPRLKEDGKVIKIKIENLLSIEYPHKESEKRGIFNTIKEFMDDNISQHLLLYFIPLVVSSIWLILIIK